MNFASTLCNEVNSDHSGSSEPLIRIAWKDVCFLLALTAFCMRVLVVLSRLATPEGLSHDGAYLINLGEQLYLGNGFVTPVVWNLYLRPDALPIPYAGANGPLVSVLVALAYHVGGVSFRSAQIPGIFLGSLVPALTYLLARQLKLKPTPAVGAALLAAVHPILALRSCTIGSDLPYTVVFLTCLVAYHAGRRPYHGLLLGVLLGVLTLVRYQGVLLLAVIVLSVHLTRQRDYGYLIAIALAFSAVFGPWAARNILTLGSPFYSYASDYFFIIGTHPAGTGLIRMESEPPSQLLYLVRHPMEFLGGVLYRSRIVLTNFVEELVGNLGLGVGLVLALPYLWRGAPKALPMILYACAITSFFLLSYLEIRYLTSLIPLIVILAAYGLYRSSGRLAMEHGWKGAQAWWTIVAFLGLQMAIDSYRIVGTKGTESFRSRAATALGAADYFREIEPWSTVVMSGAPEYIACFHKQYAVSLPYDLRADLVGVLSRHRVGYLVLQDREFDELATLPRDIAPVFEEEFAAQNVHVLRIESADARRRLGHD